MKPQERTRFEIFKRIAWDIDWDAIYLGQKAEFVDLDKYHLTRTQFHSMIHGHNLKKWCKQKLRTKTIGGRLCIYADLDDDKGE